jgi:hypothetical protein
VQKASVLSEFNIFRETRAGASLIWEKGIPKKRSRGLNAFYCVLRLSVRALNLCRREMHLSVCVCVWPWRANTGSRSPQKVCADACVRENRSRGRSKAAAANSGAKAFRCRLANRRLRRQLFLCTVARACIFIGWRLLSKCQKKDEHKLEV